MGFKLRDVAKAGKGTCETCKVAPAQTTVVVKGKTKRVCFKHSFVSK